HRRDVRSRGRLARSRGVDQISRAAAGGFVPPIMVGRSRNDPVRPDPASLFEGTARCVATFVEQVARTNAQRLTETPDRQQGRVLLAALNQSDMSAVDAHACAYLFLAEAGRSAVTA